MSRYRENMSAGLGTEREMLTNSNANGRDSEALGTPFDSRNSLHGGNSRILDDALSRLLTVEEVAVLLNVPRKWIYRRVGLKAPEGIPYLKVGKYLRFRESDLREYVERLRRN